MSNKPNEYNVTVAQLKGVMELKNAEALDEINKQFGSVDNLVSNLKSHLQDGIVGDDIPTRTRIYGRNEIPPKPPKSIFMLAFEALQDPILMLLIFCAVISIGLSFYHPAKEAQSEEVRLVSSGELNLEWVEGVAIAIAVIVVVSVSSFNDWRKERQFRGLQDRISKENNATVVRDKKMQQVNVKDLVVGDICCIKYGDLVPADGVIIDASDLKIDESSLTGETDLIKKNTSQNITILSGNLNNQDIVLNLICSLIIYCSIKVLTLWREVVDF
jgi:Ca2+ transporting ATPase